jgi:WD40 repeat protein
MTNLNPFRRTFLRSYWARECSRAEEPYHGWLSGPGSGATNRSYLTKLTIDLGVRQKDQPGPPVPLGRLIAKGKRIALFDLIGAGKRTAARQVFHARMVEARDVDPEFLPCWLPDIDEDKCRDGDLIQAIARVTGDPSGPGFDRGRVESWLRYGRPVLLFLELDRFTSQAQGEALSYLRKLYRTFGNTCCILICYSNLGSHQESLEDLGFTLYEVQRPPGGHQVDRHGGRSSWSALPLWQRLFADFPEAVKARTDFETFERVEQQIFRTKFHDLQEIRATFGTLERYQQAMQEALGLTALLTLHSPRDESGRWSHQWIVSPVYASILDILRRTRGRLPLEVILNVGEPSLNDLQPLLDLREAVAACGLPFLVRRLSGVTFVDDNFLAYFAALYLWQYALHGQNEHPWHEVLLRFFEGWPPLSARVAEFVGGLLSRGEPVSRGALEELLRAAMIGKPDREHPGKALPRTIFSLCLGADPEFPVPAALCQQGRTVRGWYALDDPLLLRGELHALLMDGARAGTPAGAALREFARGLGDRLVGAGCAWVQRVWQVPYDVGLATEHDDRVTALRVLFDGRIVSGDASGVVAVWDRRRKVGCRIAQKLHEGPVRALDELIADGRRWIVSAGDDRTVRLWCPEPTPAERKTQPRAHAGKVLALAVVPDGTHPHVVSAGEDGFLYDWSPSRSGEPTATRRRHWGSVRWLWPLPETNPPLVVSAGDDGSVGIWGVEPIGLEFRCFLPPPKELHPITPLAGEPRRREKCSSGMPPKELHPITALAGDASGLVWGDELGRVFFVNLPRDHSKRVFPERIEPGSVLWRRKHTRAVTSLRLAGDHFLSEGLDGQVFEWRWAETRLQAEDARGPDRTGQENHSGRMKSCRVLAANGSPELVMAQERQVRIRKRGGQTGRVEGHRSRVTALALGTDFFVSGGGDGSVMLFTVDGDWKKGQFGLSRQWPDHHQGPVRFLRVCEPCPAGRGEDAGKPLIVTAGQDGMVCVWRGAPGALALHAVWRGTAPITALWAAGDAIVWAGKDGRIFAGDPRTEKLSLLWTDKTGSEVTALDLRRAAADGSAVDVVAATGNEEVFWGSALGASTPWPAVELARLKVPASGGRDVIQAVRWLDGDRVALAGRDRVDVVDARGAAAARTYQTKGLSVLGRSPSGRWLVFGTAAGEVHPLDGNGATHLRLGHRVVDLQFVDEDTLLWANRDGKVLLGSLAAATDPKILAGYPLGGQITTMAVRGQRALVGLADGSLVALSLHLPRRPGG